MSKATEENAKLKPAIIVSVVLHIILISILIWSSFDEYIDASAGGGSSMDAVMVDPGAVVDSYNRQQQQAEEPQQKQAAEQHRLKELEKERLAAQEQTKAQAEKQKQAAAAKAKADAQAKAQADAQAKAAEDAAKKAAADAQKKAIAEAAKQAAAEKAAADKKAAADAKKKAAAEKATADKAAAQGVDDLFGDLSSGENAPKTGGWAKGNAAAAGKGDNKKNGASGAENNGYAGQIKAAIESKFYNDPSFSGKTCSVRIKLAPDGLLLDIKPEGGDAALCQAAVAAARLAKIPQPPSEAVYEFFKNAPIDFKP